MSGGPKKPWASNPRTVASSRSALSTFDSGGLMMSTTSWIAGSALSRSMEFQGKALDGRTNPFVRFLEIANGRHHRGEAFVKQAELLSSKLTED